MEHARQPLGALGTILGSVIFVFFWDLLYYPRFFGIDLYLLFVGEFTPETYQKLEREAYAQPQLLQQHDQPFSRVKMINLHY